MNYIKTKRKEDKENRERCCEILDNYKEDTTDATHFSVQIDCLYDMLC